MKITQPYLRLQSLWGWIEERHNQIIISLITLSHGRRVLDVGCGFGSLSNYLRLQGFDVVGVDSDEKSLEAAHRLYPQTRFLNTEIESSQLLTEGRYDAVILKDSLHHIIHEGDPDRTMVNIKHLLKPGGQLIIADPNPMFLLRLARKLVFHKDPEVTYVEAVKWVKESNFSVENLRFYEVIGLPLSGGYVGPRWIPNIDFLNRWVTVLNDHLSRLVNFLGIQRWVCWRYFIAARKKG